MHSNSSSSFNLFSKANNKKMARKPPQTNTNQTNHELFFIQSTNTSIINYSLTWQLIFYSLPHITLNFIIQGISEIGCRLEMILDMRVFASLNTSLPSHRQVSGSYARISFSSICGLRKLALRDMDFFARPVSFLCPHIPSMLHLFRKPPAPRAHLSGLRVR